MVCPKILPGQLTLDLFAAPVGSPQCDLPPVSHTPRSVPRGWCRVTRVVPTLPVPLEPLKPASRLARHPIKEVYDAVLQPLFGSDLANSIASFATTPHPVATMFHELLAYERTPRGFQFLDKSRECDRRLMLTAHKRAYAGHIPYEVAPPAGLYFKSCEKYGREMSIRRAEGMSMDEEMETYSFLLPSFKDFVNEGGGVWRYYPSICC